MAGNVKNLDEILCSSYIHKFIMTFFFLPSQEFILYDPDYEFLQIVIQFQHVNCLIWKTNFDKKLKQLCNLMLG